MAAKVRSWRLKVLITRRITSVLLKELSYISDMYSVSIRRKLDLYELDRGNEEEYVALAGIISDKDKDFNRWMKLKRQEHELECEKLKQDVRMMIENRVRLIKSEMSHLRRSQLSQTGRRKLQRRRSKRGQLSNVREIQDTLNWYMKLLEERECLINQWFMQGLATYRHETVLKEYETERFLDRTNLHKFVSGRTGKDTDNILKKSGGLVPREVSRAQMMTQKF